MKVRTVGIAPLVGTNPQVVSEEGSRVSHSRATLARRMAEAIAKDQDYSAKLDAVGGLFVEGLARRTLACRIVDE